MRWTLAPEDRERHVRSMWHVLVALVLAMIGRGLLGFDLVQTLGYGVLAYILLNVLSYRTMFLKQDKDSDKRS